MGISIWQLIIIAFIIGAIVFGVWLNVRILNKTGYSGWWTAILFVPVVNIIMIWVFAFAKWPILSQRRSVGISKESFEEELYEQVANEINEGKRREGLWAKALEKSEGMEDKAKALYIGYRVKSLKDDIETAKAAPLLDQKQRVEQCESLLRSKGYKLISKKSGWIIKEKLGGKQAIETLDELEQYANSR